MDRGETRGVKVDKQQIADFCRRHHIARLSLFGSVLRSDFSSDSDVDVLVEFKQGHVPGLAFFSMQEELSGILGRPVDLNTRGWLGPEILDRALSSEEVQYVAE